jgi:hypothetical protein
MTDTFNEAWMAVMTEYADVISASWHGHLHDDTFRLLSAPAAPAAVSNGTSASALRLGGTRTNSAPVGSAKATSVGVQLCVPSITTWTQENPRVRLVEYQTDKYTGTGDKDEDDEYAVAYGLLNWQQYYTDLDRDNALKAIDWQLEYDLLQEYNMHNSTGEVLTATHFAALYERMVSE